VNRFDVLLLVLAAALALLGAWRGLLRLGLGVAGLVGGIALAIRWEERATPLMRRVIDSDLWAPLAAFSAIVVAVAVAAGLLSVLLHGLLRRTRLAWVDRVAGAVAGVLAAFLISAGASVLLAAGLPRDSRLLADSALAPATLKVGAAVARVAPPDLRRRFEDGMKRLAVSA
jgi:uncharacterized membrane protein required for colicin V production